MLRYLLNRLASEKVIEYMSQTYVIKRAAQITVSAYYHVSRNKNLNDLFKHNKLQNFFKTLRGHLHKEIKDVQNEIKKHKK